MRPFLSKIIPNVQIESSTLILIDLQLLTKITMLSLSKFKLESENGVLPLSLFPAKQGHLEFPVRLWPLRRSALGFNSAMT